MAEIIRCEDCPIKRCNEFLVKRVGDEARADEDGMPDFYSQRKRRNMIGALRAIGCTLPNEAIVNNLNGLAKGTLELHDE